MFDLFPMLLSSVASFLFPIFASYKALKTSDPTQLTPWLMYWVVLSCCLLVESWVWFIISWIPFYGYFRLMFLLYLILPQTQGAAFLYDEYVHPYLEKNETQIDDFIASAHERLTAAGISYLKLAIEQFRVKVLGLPPSEPEAPPPETNQGYTQSLLSRFNVPAARWAGNNNNNNGGTGTDFYSLLSSAVAAATNAGAAQSAGTRTVGGEPTNPGALIPPHLRESGARMDFISTQRDRLNVLLSALDREAQDLRSDAQRAQANTGPQRDPMAYGGYDNTRNDDEEPTQRPPSGLSGWSGISKSRSETDFERIDADVSSDEDHKMRRRNMGAGTRNTSGSWVPWSWGGDAAQGGASASGRER